jgi:hypothetical protein
MAGSGDRGRWLRGVWTGLCVLSLVGAGAAFGLGRYELLRLEGEAERAGSRLAVQVFEPVLTPGDLDGPVRGARYTELLKVVREGLLAGPIEGVRLWSAEGVVLFADDRSLVGGRDPQTAELLSAATSTPRSRVEDERFLTLTPIRVDGSNAPIAAELERSHPQLVTEARERWDPWVGRGLAAAAVFGGLAVLTSLALAAMRRVRRRRPARAAAEPVLPPAPGRADPQGPTDLPAYMLPGFQDEVLARRRMEEELEAATQERDRLAERCRRLEADLDEARGRGEGTPALHGSGR